MVFCIKTPFSFLQHILTEFYSMLKFAHYFSTTCRSRHRCCYRCRRLQCLDNILEQSKPEEDMMNSILKLSKEIIVANWVSELLSQSVEHQIFSESWIVLILANSLHLVLLADVHLEQSKDRISLDVINKFHKNARNIAPEVHWYPNP